MRYFHGALAIATGLLTWHFVDQHEYKAMGAVVCFYVAFLSWLIKDLDEP